MLSRQPAYYRDLFQSFQHQAQQAYALAVFGDHLAERWKYHQHSGMDAVYYHLCCKHCWQPAQARSLSVPDLLFLLQEEMNGWVMPDEALPDGVAATSQLQIQ